MMLTEEEEKRWTYFCFQMSKPIVSTKSPLAFQLSYFQFQVMAAAENHTVLKIAS